MGVYHPQSMGIGGGFIMTLYKRGDKKGEVIDAREVAPDAANETMFKGKSSLTQLGGLAVAVPGEVRGYSLAHEKYGRLPWSDLVQPAIGMCQEGVRVSGHLSRALQGMKRFILKEPSLREAFFNNNTGDVYKKGEIMRRPKLKETLQRLAEKGAEDLYVGELGRKLVEDIQQFGGVITLADMKKYSPVIRQALRTTFHNGITMYTAPPPGSGCVLAHALYVLEGYGMDSSSLSTEASALAFAHRLAETLKFSFARRSQLGDPAFVHVEELVARLLTPEYAKHTRHKIRLDGVLSSDRYGAVIHMPDDSGTAHVAVLAANGDAVSATSTVNTWVGAGIRSRQTGIVLNNQMDDFSSPNITNHFGVRPSPANLIRPGKRPLSSMCPAIFVDSNGDAELIIGAAGGTRILSSLTQVAARTLWMGENIKAAIDARRLHHQLHPNEVMLEDGFPDALARGLQKLGHKVVFHSPRGSSIIAIQRMKDGRISAYADPRKDGGTSGY